MAFGRSGDKTVQLIGVIFAAYVLYVGYTTGNVLLGLIGLLTILYDGYLLLFEQR